MKKLYPLIVILLVAFHAPSLAFSKYNDGLNSTLKIKSENLVGISGNLSICLPGTGTTQLTGSGIPNAVNPWSSSNTNVATINNTGLVTAVNIGSTTISFIDNLGNIASVVVYVSAFPTITSASGSFSTCESGSLQLNGTLFPATTTPWESSNTAIATVDDNGLVTGVSGGTCVITYTNLGGCKTTQTIIVNPLLGTTITCGTWTPNQRTFNWNAVVGANGYAVIYRINGGSFTLGTIGNILTYTVFGVLETDKVEVYITPNGAPGSCFSMSSISCQAASCPTAGSGGAITVCDGNTSIINLSNIITGESSGGVWTRTDGSGGVFDANAGTFMPVPGATTSVFVYTIAGVTPCPNSTSNVTITIIGQPNAGVLAGVQNICVGSTTSFTSTVIGGTWSSSDPTVATINPASGIITGISAGTATMTYTVTGMVSCGTATTTRTVNVSAPPTPGILSGIQNVCVGLTSTFVSTIPGGTWSSSNPAVATINGATGVLTGIAVGSATMTYTVSGTGGCVNVSTTRNVTVNPNVALNLFSSPSTSNQIVCVNNFIVPIVYSMNSVATGASIIAGTLPAGVSGNYDAGNNTFTISGIASEAGSFNYLISTTGGNCGSASLSGNITVNPMVTLTLTSAPPTTNQSVCHNMPIDPIVYTLNSGATGTSVTGLPAGISANLSSGVCTISGTSTVIGTFPYIISNLGGCGTESLSGTITVGSSNPTLFCESSLIPNSIRFDWSQVPGVTNYQYSYSINGGTEVSGSTTITHYDVLGVLPGQSVLFSVIINETNCPGITSVVCNALSNEDFQNDALQYFPNPVDDILNISNLKTTSNIQIVNAIGQLVYNKTVSSHDMQINTSGFSQGIYIVKVASNEGTKTFKILKK